MTCTVCGTANPDGMRFCGMCGSQLEQPLGVRERRRVSVVFIDLAAFSNLTRDFDPEELRDLADEVLTVVAGIIEDYDGYVDAFRGDGLIALFGAPHSHPDDPQRAVLAAAAGLEAIERIGASKNYPLKGRAGVNTGIVIAGSVGSGRVRDYTVMGSAVNLSARLEAAAPPGEVWVGGATFEATRHRLGYELIAPVELPGFPNVRQAYRLVSVSERAEDDPYAHLEFVGRETEMAALTGRFETVVANASAHEVWLLGEAGSGKTRLLKEFFERLEPGRARVLWIESRPTEQYSWEPLAQQLFGLHEGEDAAIRRHRMTSQLNRLLPDEPRWRGLVLASLKMADQKPWTRLERRSVNRTSLAWCDLLVALSRQRDGPSAVILVVENEPQDPPLLEFLRLLRQTQAPILVIRTCRGRNLPAERETVTLSPLGVSESLKLLNQLASPVLKVAAESLVYQVGGIPAYILELGQALSITREVPFSGSLASLLQARLDMIEPKARRLLSHAALAGERCWEGLLHELVGHSRGEEIRTLAELNLLIRQNDTSIPEETEYRFQSELLRHAVLRMTPFRDRPLLHLKIATWLEQRAPLVFSELTAYHFERGGSADAAYAHLLAASDLAMSADDADRASDLFERLLALEVGPALRAEGALAYAQAALVAGRGSLAREQLEVAHGWIERCDQETSEELTQVHQQLYREAVGIEEAEAEPGRGSGQQSGSAPAARRTSGGANAGGAGARQLLFEGVAHQREEGSGDDDGEKREGHDR